MSYAADQLLEHDHLGLGKVLNVEGDHVSIHFKKDRLTRKMSAKHSPLKPAAVQHDPYFDGVKSGASAPRSSASRSRSTVRKPKVAGKYPTHEAAVAGFLKIFPLGFNDPKYLIDDAAGERSYKAKAHDLWNATLNQQEFERLIAEKSFDEAVQRAKSVESGVNLLNPRFERLALWKGAAADAASAEKFSLNLFDLIYGEDHFEAKFNRFAAMLGELPQTKSAILKWPAMTILPFLALPTQHLFMKPEVTKKAAKRLNFALNYVTTPNWSTYSALLDFGRMLLQDLAPLKPRDMIDVQSFIFVTGHDDYPGA